MRTYRGLRLKNVLFYKEAYLDLDYRGITVIRGRNLNAKNGKRSNGAGKSLLVSTIANCSFNSHPVLSIGKKSAGTKKSLMGKESEIELTFDRDKTKYTLCKFSKKAGSVYYRILKNGKDTEIRTPTLAEKAIPEILGINEEEFYTFDYLDGRRQHILQTGSPTDRLRFFSNVFRLHEYDVIKGICESRMKKLKEDNIRLDMYQSQFEELTGQLQAINIKSVEEKLDSYSEQIQTLKKESDKLYAQLDSYRLYKAHSHNRKLAKEAATYFELDFEDTVEFVTSLIECVDKGIFKLEKAESKHEAYKEYKSQLKQYKQQKKRLVKEKKKISFSGTLKKAKKRLAKIENEHDEVKSKLALDRSRLAELPETFEINKDLEKQARKIPKDFNNLALLADSELSQAEKQIKHLNKHIKKGGNCSYCGSEISPKKAKKIVKDLEAKVSILKDQIKLYYKQKDVLEEWETYSKEKEIYLASKKDRKELKKSIKVRDAELAEYTASITTLRKVVEILSLEKSISKSKPEKVEKVSYDPGTLKTLEQFKTALDQYKDAVGNITRISDPDKIEQRYKKLQDKLNKLHSRLPELEAVKKQYDQNVKKKTELEEKLGTLKKKLSDMEIYKMLIDAYSSKGVKNLVVQHLAGLVQQNMNLHANLLFSENFEFEWKIAPNKFDIIVHRHHKEGTITSDVRSMSNAESKAFALLCTIAMLPLIPPSRRSNMIILDEMDANMDDVGQDLYINNFLPTLNTLVPHVIAVTPSSLEFPSSRNFVAVKKGIRTKLEAVS